jgi:hypothetical protein
VFHCGQVLHDWFVDSAGAACRKAEHLAANAGQFSPARGAGQRAVTARRAH